ncbi:MAG TPA: NAD(P)-dependent oxidoreductase [Candidatus Dormibacteraeota bacterium]|nr:NAD(P)-dependent oxidoreductase [Candidatus Dormibacteraeota bacterium]
MHGRILMKPSVGFIGLGLMGRPMAANLLKVGYSVTVWNRTASRGDDLVAQGARRAATPGEAAAASDAIITIVSDPPAVESVLWGDAGVFTGLRRGSVIIESSTVTPSLEKRAAAAAAALGAEFLEAPVTGGTWGAEKGELVFMVGGEAGTLDRVKPLLDVMGKQYFHLGPVGAGQTVKLAMNLLLALEVEAFAEALALVTRAGVPGENLLQVMQSSMGRSPVLDLKGAKMLQSDYKPSFPLRLMHKDLSLAIDLGNQLGVPVPAAAAAREILSAVKGAMTEDVDFSALATFWNKK